MLESMAEIEKLIADENAAQKEEYKHIGALWDSQISKLTDGELMWLVWLASHRLYIPAAFPHEAFVFWNEDVKPTREEFEEWCLEEQPYRDAFADFVEFDNIGFRSWLANRQSPKEAQCKS